MQICSQSIDKVKLCKLQCTRNENMNIVMGFRASSAIPSGNYYLMTNSEYFYALGANGTQSYLDGLVYGMSFSIYTNILIKKINYFKLSFTLCSSPSSPYNL